MPAILRWLRKRRLFILSTLSLLLFLALLLMWRLSYVNFPDGYAKWDAATLLIEYMETHDGRWPTGWHDLRDVHARLRGAWDGTPRPSIRTPSFEEISSRVGIDWSADPKRLATATPDHAREPFRVVWALSGTTTTITEPNQLILDYLRRRPTTRPAKSERVETAPAKPS